MRSLTLPSVEPQVSTSHSEEKVLYRNGRGDTFSDLIFFRQDILDTAKSSFGLQGFQEHNVSIARTGLGLVTYERTVGRVQGIRTTSHNLRITFSHRGQRYAGIFNHSIPKLETT